MHEDRALTGARGERLVAAHLEAQGFALIARNARIGRLEIDLIAARDGLFVFCEVRTRKDDRFMDPIASIGPQKTRNIRRAAVAWLQANEVFAREIRFDAASVLLDRDPPKLTYYADAF